MVRFIKRGASKKSIAGLIKQLNDSKFKGIDAKKYCGKIKLKKDAVLIQLTLRDEWN